MSSSNISKKSVNREFFKTAGGILVGSVGSYFSQAMPTTTDLAKEVKSASSTAISKISSAPQQVSQKMKQIRQQFTVKNITNWFTGKTDSYDSGSDTENLGFDEPTDSSDNPESTMVDTNAPIKAGANTIAKAVTEANAKMFEGQLNMTANVVSAIDNQTSVMEAGFRDINKTLSDILEVVTKNTATMIETAVAASREREETGSSKMLNYGKFSLDSYMKTISQNMDNNIILGQIKAYLPFVQDFLKDPSKLFEQDPKETIKGVLSGGMGMLLDKFAPAFEETLHELDDTINDRIMSSLVKLGQNANQFGGPKGILADLFGIKSHHDDFSNVSRSSIEVKNVPFDTISREAITNAIPGYLRKILVALGGEDAVYDYRSRSFRSMAAIKKEFNDRATNHNMLYESSDRVYNAFMSGHNDDFGKMMYDLMTTRMSQDQNSNEILTKVKKGELSLGDYLIETLTKTGTGVDAKDTRRIREIESKYKKILQAGGNPADEISLQIAKRDISRSRSVESLIDELDKYNIDVSQLGISKEDEFKHIATRNGRKGSTINARVTTKPGELAGLDYTNLALYRIFQRLNTGINVFKVGEDNSKANKFKAWGDYHLPAPKNSGKNIRTEIESSDSGGSRSKINPIEDTGPNLLEAETDEDGNVLTTSDKAINWLKSRGKGILDGFKSGDSGKVAGNLIGAGKDLGAVFTKKINGAFGNVSGYLKHKFTGAEYTYTDTDEDGNPVVKKVAAIKDGGIFGFIGKEFKDSLKSVKESGGKWFKDVSGYFKFDKAEGEDNNAANRRNKFMSASVGAMAGAGILGGPFGMIMGGLAGSMLGGLDIGTKIKETLFGRDEEGKPTGILTKLSDKIIDPIKYQFIKTGQTLGKIMKKNVLGPLSDLGQAIKDRITASAETHLGKAFKFIGKAIMAPFKFAGKLLLNIVKLPINILGGLTRGAAKIGGGLFGNFTEGLAKGIAKGSTATHTVVDEDGTTRELSSSQFIKERRKKRNKEIDEEYDEKAKNIGSLKDFQKNERLKKAARRQRLKDMTAEEVVADNTSSIAENLSELTEHATTTTGDSSIYTHDEGLHELLKQIIGIISGFGGEDVKEKAEEAAESVDQVHAPETPSDEVGSVSEVINESQKQMGIKDKMLSFAKNSKRKLFAAMGIDYDDEVDDESIDNGIISKIGEKTESIVGKIKDVASTDIIGSLKDKLFGEKKKELNRNDDNQAEEAEDAKGFTSSMLSAAAAISATNGTDNDDDTNMNDLANEASSRNPSKNKVKSILNKILKNDNKKTAEKSEKQESFLSKIFSGVGNIFGGIKSFFSGDGFLGGIGSIFMKYILPIGSILGVGSLLAKNSDGTILGTLSNVKNSVSEWWNNPDNKLHNFISGIGPWWDENKEKVGEFFTSAFETLGKIWDQVILPLKDPLIDLLTALVPIIGNLASRTADVITHIGDGATGKEEASAAGANAVLGKLDMEVDNVGALYNPIYGDISHNEQNGAGDDIKNVAASNYVQNKAERPIYDQIGRQGFYGWRASSFANKSENFLNKAVDFENRANSAYAAGNTALGDKLMGKAESSLAKAEKYETKSNAANDKMNAQKGVALHGVTRSIVGGALANGFGNAAGGLAENFAISIGVDPDNASTIGNVSEMAVSGLLTADLAASTVKGNKKGFINKILDMFEKFINKIAELIKGGKVTDDLPFTDKVFAKADDFFAKIIKKIPLLDKALQKADDILIKLGTRMGAATAEQAASVATAAIMVAVGALNGLINGLCGVEHLFGVLPDRADGLMIGISSFIKTLFGTLETIPGVGIVISILDVLDAIIAAVFGKGFTQLLAEALYGWLGDEAYLKEQQAQFADELAYYNEKYGTNLNTSSFNDMANRDGWMDMLWKGKQDYDAEGHLHFDEAGGTINHGMEQLFVGGERQYYKDAEGNVMRDENGQARQLVDAHGNAIKKDMKWGDHVGNWFKNTFVGGDIYETDENGVAKIDEDGNYIVAGHEGNFFEKWVDFFKGLGSSIYQFFSKIPKAAKDSIDGQAAIWKAVPDGDVSGLWEIEDKIDEDNPVSALTVAGNFVTKLIATVPTLFVGVGKSIWDFFVKLGSSASMTTRNVANNTQRVWNTVKSGSVSQLWSISDNVDKNNILGGVVVANNIITKIIATVPTLITGVGKSIWDFFTKVGESIPSAFNSTIENIGIVAGSVVSGDIEGLWAIEDSTDESNILSGVTSAMLTIGKIIYTPGTAMFWLGKQIKEFFMAIPSAITNGFKIIVDNNAKIAEYAGEGKISDMWKLEYEDDENNPIGGLMGGIFVIQKVMNTPLAAFRWIGNKIGEGFSIISTAIQEDKTNFDKALSSITDAAGTGDIDKIWNVSFTPNKSNPIGGLFNVGVIITKMFNTIPAMINKVAGKVIRTIEKLNNGDWLGAWNEIISVDPPASGGDNSDVGVHSGGGGSHSTSHSTHGGSAGRARGGDTNSNLPRGGTVTEGGNPINDTPSITSHFGPRTDPFSGYHNGIDIVSANGRDNVEVGTRYKGKVVKIVSNVPDYARAQKNSDGSYSYPYKGTYPDGGNQVWVQADNGFLIKNMHLKANSIPSNLKEGSEVDIGDKLGIMGSTGWSTGNHLHYQIEKNGTALDPEANVMNGSTISGFNDSSNGSTYQSDEEITSENWLSKMLTSISEFGSKLLGRLTGGLFGSTNSESKDGDSADQYIGNYSGDLNDEAAVIWNYLKSKGWSDEAVSAVLGCWTCESGVKARTIEYDYCNSSLYPTASKDGKFPYDEVINSKQLMDQWAKYLFGMYDRSGISIYREGYKALDGYYYPGIGYAGWTGDNTRQMLEYARDKKAAWDDPRFQLDWMEHQLNDITYFKNLDTMNKLENARTPEEAATIFATDFEGCPSSWQDKRRAAARAIWNANHGKDAIEGASTNISNVSKLGALDDWDSDWDSFVRNVINPPEGYASTAIDAYTKQFPNAYAEYKAGLAFERDAVKKHSAAGASSWINSEPGKAAREQFIKEFMDEYKKSKLAKGGESEDMSQLDMPKMSKIMDDTFNEAGKGGDNSSLRGDVPTDYSEEMATKKVKISYAKGGDSTIAPSMFASKSPNVPSGNKNIGGSKASVKVSYGKGGTPDKYTYNEGDTNISFDIDRIIDVLNIMVSELKSISGSSNASVGYLDAISQKEFVDQGLRDSITSLDKIRHKQYPVNTSSGGTKKTIANLARPT